MAVDAAKGDVPPPSPARASFASVVAGRPSIPYVDKSFSTASRSSLAGMAVLSTRKGEPAVTFSKAAINHAAEPYRFALVGKFSQGRPNLDDIRKFFRSLDFTDPPTIGLLDRRHVLLKFAREADFHRVWSRPVWQVYRCPMRVFRWTKDFHVAKESPLAPVWFSLPALPVHYFHKDLLFQIMACMGRPLCVDAATAMGSRPSVARVCVEVDLLAVLPSRVWISEEEEPGFWQEVQAENLPKYCGVCFHQGHAEEDCRIKNPDLRERGKSTMKVVDGDMDRERGKGGQVRNNMEKVLVLERDREKSIAGFSEDVQPVVAAPSLLETMVEVETGVVESVEVVDVAASPRVEAAVAVPFPAATATATPPRIGADETAANGGSVGENVTEEKVVVDGLNIAVGDDLHADLVHGDAGASNCSRQHEMESRSDADEAGTQAVDALHASPLFRSDNHGGTAHRIAATEEHQVIEEMNLSPRRNTPQVHPDSLELIRRRMSRIRSRLDKPVGSLSP